MKEATGELNMTLITVIAIAAIGGFLMFFLPGIIDNIKNQWNQGAQCVTGTDAGGNPVYGPCPK